MSEHTESLEQQVRFLTSELTSTHMKGRAATLESEAKHLKNFKRSEAIRKRNVDLRNQLSLANAQLEITKSRATVLTHKVESLTAELQQVQAECIELKAALLHQPGAALRWQIKQLCSKYHPDKCVDKSRSVPCEEVIRDLVELLSV